MSKKILIVEDEKDLSKVLQDTLTDQGFETIVAKDGEEGLQLAVSEKPDLILLDVLMPKKNGIEMLKDLRENDSIVPPPIVILLSNADTTENVFESMKYDVSDFLVKSDWELDQIVEHIKKKLV